MAFQLEFPHKLWILACMVELIREEPLTSISSPIRQKAMTIISNFRMLRPLLGIEEREEILQTCLESVLCLPATEVLQKEASSPEEAQANVVLLDETLQSLQSLMEALVLETPTWMENCLELLDRWLNSQRIHEQERAMSCAARILDFTAKMDNFKMEIEFTRLENLVMLLAKHCQHPAASIRFQSSKAVYQLYCVLLRKKKMQRKTSGLREDDGKIEVYSANVFNQNTFEIAKAFAEFFTQTQLTNLVLMAEEDLTDSRAEVSVASAQLMSALMEERGTDIIEVKEIVENILCLLRLQLEHDTEKETLRAMCSLAGSNTHTVVPMLLKKPFPWDRTLLALWNAFGTQEKSTVKVLQLLIGILENHSIEERTKRDSQPDPVACALYEMLSGSLCHKAIQELYPQLLLALLRHLHWVVKQKDPEEIVVYSKDEGPGSKSKTFDPKRCALEIVKMVVLAGSNEGVMVHADQHKCWDLLICPRFCYLGIMELTSGIVKNCEPAMLHEMLNLVTNLISSSDSDQKVVARAVYAQLLRDQSVTETPGQDFVGNLRKWIKEPNRIMKEIGLCGISNLTAHPGNKSESLKSLVPLLTDLLKNEMRVSVTVQAVKTLQNLIRCGHGGNSKERDPVRITAVSALCRMLSRVCKFSRKHVLREEMHYILVPLLLNFQDNNTEVVKACGEALIEWSKVTGWSPLIRLFRDTSIKDPMLVLEKLCKYLVSTCKTQFLGELLFQSFGFLTSTEPFLQAAALNFIGLIVARINLKDIREDDVHLLKDALQKLKNDPVESNQMLVNTLLEKIEKNINSQPGSASIMSHMKTKFFNILCMNASPRKKRLFKTLHGREIVTSIKKKRVSRTGRWRNG
ncbi:maestro heat-like repeat-containing protein family member 7 [Saccopteryx leptura]|uniref:maestro heat-like repeat-containing protein family member 7 n=1 Tax=Saccopteryx leptura TaxID=249018 RepID=UPI00339C9AF8